MCKCGSCHRSMWLIASTVSSEAQKYVMNWKKKNGRETGNIVVYKSSIDLNVNCMSKMKYFLNTFMDAL